MPKWKNVGEIIEWDGKKAKVALGAQAASGFGKAFIVVLYPIEMEKLNERELRTLLGIKGLNKANLKQVSITVQSDTQAFVEEQFDVRGQRLDDALISTGNYIDRAFGAGGRRRPH